MFGLKTSQECVDGEVGVKENFREMVEMIMGIQFLTLKCLVKVFFLKSFLEKLLTISLVMRVYIILIKV